MIKYELPNSCVGSDSSANCATNTPPRYKIFFSSYLNSDSERY